LKLSARNRLSGRVTKVTLGEAAAAVELDVAGNRMVASITAEAVRDLDLKEGVEVIAIVKASDVILARED